MQSKKHFFSQTYGLRVTGCKPPVGSRNSLAISDLCDVKPGAAGCSVQKEPGCLVAYYLIRVIFLVSTTSPASRLLISLRQKAPARRCSGSVSLQNRSLFLIICLKDCLAGQKVTELSRIQRVANGVLYVSRRSSVTPALISDYVGRVPQAPRGTRNPTLTGGTRNAG